MLNNGWMRGYNKQILIKVHYELEIFLKDLVAWKIKYFAIRRGKFNADHIFYSCD